MFYIIKFNKKLREYLINGDDQDQDMMDLTRGVVLKLIEENEEEFLEMLSQEINSYIESVCLELVKDGELDFGIDKDGEVVYWNVDDEKIRKEYDS